MEEKRFFKTGKEQKDFHDWQDLGRALGDYNQLVPLYRDLIISIDESIGIADYQIKECDYRIDTDPENRLHHEQTKVTLLGVKQRLQDERTALIDRLKVSREARKDLLRDTSEDLKH